MDWILQGLISRSVNEALVYTCRISIEAWCMLCANVCVHVLVCSCSNDVFSSDFVSVTGDFHSSISRTASSHEFTCHRRAFIMLPITPAHKRASADPTTEIYACHCLQGDACALSKKHTRGHPRIHSIKP